MNDSVKTSLKRTLVGRRMPLSELVEDTDKWRAFKQRLPRDKTLILFCKIGGRSARMCEFLACEGLQTVNLGGFCEWTEAGLPVIPFKTK